MHFASLVTAKHVPVESLHYNNFSQTSPFFLCSFFLLANSRLLALFSTFLRCGVHIQPQKCTVRFRQGTSAKWMPNRMHFAPFAFYRTKIFLSLTILTGTPSLSGKMGTKGTHFGVFHEFTEGISFKSTINNLEREGRLGVSFYVVLRIILRKTHDRLAVLGIALQVRGCSWGRIETDRETDKLRAVFRVFWVLWSWISYSCYHITETIKLRKKDSVSGKFWISGLYQKNVHSDNNGKSLQTAELASRVANKHCNYQESTKDRANTSDPDTSFSDLKSTNFIFHSFRAQVPTNPCVVSNKKLMW